MKTKSPAKKIKIVRANRRVSAPNLPTLHPHAAGADIGARTISVCVPADCCAENVRTFETFTDSLQKMVTWLQSCGITTLAMESTGNYWLPLYQLLAENKIDVVLVNARHVRGVPGRKSDVLDCQWLQYLHSVGLVRGSFRPAQDICAIRSLVRTRERIVTEAANQIRAMQNACDQMNMHLHHVISDLSGTTGQAIVSAILQGERDPKKLADLCDRRIKASKQIVALSLHGDWREEHLLALRLAWESWQHAQSQLLRLDEQVARRVEALEAKIDPVLVPLPATAKRVKNRSTNEPAESEHLRLQLYRSLGVDLTAVPGINVLTAQAFLSEVGPDLRRFATSAHFCSWLGLCPGTKISGGKVLDARTRRGKPRFALLLRQAAGCFHSQKGAFGARYRALRSAHGAPKALTAMAHLMARVIYAMVTTGRSYDESHFAQLEKRHAERRLNSLHKQAQSLGLQLVPLAA